MVRPVYFPRINGHMEWTAPDGRDYDATFDDRLTRDLANQRLRTALDVDGRVAAGGAGAGPRPADAPARARSHGPAAWSSPSTRNTPAASPASCTSALGVVADDRHLRRPDASARSARFAEGSAPWIVAVRMVSEGVDIPRLRVGVYATNTVTELFFRQAVGRLVRWRAGLARQAAYMFIPDDLRLRTFAGAIAEQRRHSLRKRDDERASRRGRGAAPTRRAREAAMEEQLSLFSAISAVPLDEHGRPLEPGRIYEEEAAGGRTTPSRSGRGTSSRTTRVPAPPPGAAREGPWPGGPPRGWPRDRAPRAVAARRWRAPPLPLPDPVEPHPTIAKPKSPLARRRELREANSEVVRELVHDTGKGHAELNAELNRKAGIRRVSEATHQAARATARAGETPPAALTPARRADTPTGTRRRRRRARGP